MAKLHGLRQALSLFGGHLALVSQAQTSALKRFFFRLKIGQADVLADVAFIALHGLGP